MKNQARFYLCVWLATSQQWVNQPFYITSEVNGTIKCCLFIAPTSDRIYVIFCPILPMLRCLLPCLFQANSNYINQFHPFLPVSHDAFQFNNAQASIISQLVYICCCWSSSLSCALLWFPEQQFTYHLILFSPTVSYKPQPPDHQCICNLRKVAVPIILQFFTE